MGVLPQILEICGIVDVAPSFCHPKPISGVIFAVAIPFSHHEIHEEHEECTNSACLKCETGIFVSYKKLHVKYYIILFCQ
jgi:hypothetical protein